MAFTFKGEDCGIRYTVDNTDATFMFEVADVGPSEKEYTETLYPNYADAIKNAGKFFGTEMLPSIDMIRGKGKQFDDGLYAAIELAAAEKLGNIKDGKAKFLKNLYSEIENSRDKSQSSLAEYFNEALSYIAGGLELLGESVDTDGAVGSKVSEKLSKFNSDSIQSKPLGFYTWSEKLSQIFKSDRFYQGVFDIDNDADTKAALILSDAIYSNPDLKEQYEAIVNLYGRLTNPASTISMGAYYSAICSAGDDFDSLLSSGIGSFRNELKATEAYRKQAGKAPCITRKIGSALFPHSYSKETDLFNKTQASYESGDLMSQLIEAIRSGRLSLMPSEESGWYDHQLYALETLLVTEKGEESKKLSIGEKYKKRLVEAFKTMITKARETHVKQIEMGMTLRCVMPVQRKKVKIKPKFDAEPIATLYKRNALGYAYLKKALDSVLGEGALSGIYRLKEDGSKSEMSLDSELDFMTDLMYGFYKISCDNLGMDTQSAFGKEYLTKAESTAKKWIEGMGNDNDLERDTRVIVPVHKIATPGSTETELVNWATMGVRLLKVKMNYVKDPKVTLHTHDNGDIDVNLAGGAGHASYYDVELVPAEYIIPVDMFKEIITNKTFTRDEWRALCNKYKTADEVVASIEGKTTTGLGVSAAKVKEKAEAAGLRKKDETVFDEEVTKKLKPTDVQTMMNYLKDGFKLKK